MNFQINPDLLYPPHIYRIAGAATVQAKGQQSLFDYMNKADVLGFMLVSSVKHPDFVQTQEFCRHMMVVSRDELPKAGFELYFEGAAQYLIDNNINLDDLGGDFKDD